MSVKELLRPVPICYDTEIVRATPATVNDFSHLRLKDKFHRTVLEQMAEMYQRGWSRDGLCPDVEVAYRKVSQFDPNETFIALDRPRNTVLGMLSTLPIQAGNIIDLYNQVPMYEVVENLSIAHVKPQKHNIRICFSIVPPSDNLIYAAKAGKPVKVPRFLLFGLPEEDTYKVAYSKFREVPAGKDPLDHYRENMNNRKSSDPVFMHEAYGGIVVAIFYFSRPEDIMGAGVNAIVFYPKNTLEAEKIREIQTRRKSGQISTEKIEDNLLVFKDVSLADGILVLPE